MEIRLLKNRVKILITFSVVLVLACLCFQSVFLGADFRFQKDFTVFNLEVTEVGFTGDYDIHNIVDPVWKKVGNPDGPVCYKIGSNLNMAVKLKVTPPLSSPVSISLKADGTDNVDAQKNNISISGSETIVNDIRTVGQLGNGINVISALSFDWSFSLDGMKWSSAGRSGPHKIYTILDTPRVGSSDFTDEKINFSCATADGSESPDAAATALTHEMHGDLGPWQDLYNNLLPGDGPCQARSKCLQRALAVLGVDSSIYKVGEKNSSGQWHYFYWWVVPGVTSSSPSATNFEAIVQIDNRGYDATLDRIGTMTQMTAVGPDGLIIAEYTEYWQ